jgi:hypothetical protein
MRFRRRQRPLTPQEQVDARHANDPPPVPRPRTFYPQYPARERVIPRLGGDVVYREGGTQAPMTRTGYGGMPADADDTWRPS